MATSIKDAEKEPEFAIMVRLQVGSIPKADRQAIETLNGYVYWHFPYKDDYRNIPGPHRMPLILRLMDLDSLAESMRYVHTSETKPMEIGRGNHYRALMIKMYQAYCNNMDRMSEERIIKRQEAHNHYLELLDRASTIRGEAARRRWGRGFDPNDYPSPGIFHEHCVASYRFKPMSLEEKRDLSRYIALRTGNS